MPQPSNNRLMAITIEPSQSCSTSRLRAASGNPSSLSLAKLLSIYIRNQGGCFRQRPTHYHTQYQVVNQTCKHHCFSSLRQAAASCKLQFVDLSQVMGLIFWGGLHQPSPLCHTHEGRWGLGRKSGDLTHIWVKFSLGGAWQGQNP